MSNISGGVNSRKRQILVESTDVLTRRGVVFFWDDHIDLKAVGPFSYAVETGDDVVVLRKFKIISSPDKGMDHATFEMFQDGTISGGVSTPFSITNVASLTESPFDGNEILQGVTIDVAGNLFYTRNMVGFRTMPFEDEFGPFILNPNTKYYWTLTNIGSLENENLVIQVSAVRIP